jgi:hypothetical protein
MSRAAAVLVACFAVAAAAFGPDLVARACPPVVVPPPPDIEPGPRGRLTIETRPPAAVTVEGRSFGTTPVRARWIDAGTHRVVLRTSCGTFRKTVRVAPRQDVRVRWALCPSSALPPR